MRVLGVKKLTLTPSLRRLCRNIPVFGFVIPSECEGSKISRCTLEMTQEE